LTEAASVVLARGPGSAEVYVVRRAKGLRAFGGFVAFPGGKAAPADADLLPAQPRAATAVRELFEETGVLLARHPDDSFLPSSPQLQELRRDLVEDRLSFAEVLHRLDLSIRLNDLVPVGTLTTPPFAATRFDTAFFLADLPPQQQPEVWPGELEEGGWTTADRLLQEWIKGIALISPPTLLMLEAIRGRAVAEMPARLAPHFEALTDGEIPPIWYAPQVRLLPLRTIALAPSSHTNAYLIGNDPAYLLDPGPHDPEEQGRLFAVLDRLPAKSLAAVVLSHHHPDHIGAAAACASRYSLPIWAHPLTACALVGKVQITRELHEGDRLELGTAPDGSGPWYLEALHTPGHAPGHLAFYEPHYQLLLVGDLVSTVSSIVIAPPEGDLSVYLASLRRIQGYPCRLLLPSHGSASAAPAVTLEEALAHRARREEQLIEALRDRPRTVAELGAELYHGLADNLMRFAVLQIQAGLQKLQREGRVEPLGQGPEQIWRLQPAV
jgi:glyoxylase-like metal-dependent hydrolase (beta-lactamase superfamily II)/8-oxo-dGTP pyrophosphatase MutT (NUDIX family)